MKKITIKEYAEWKGISVQAAHKRISKKSLKKYPEIKAVEKITDKFFMLKVNDSEGLEVIATRLQK
jgi:hypothetical protein